MVYTRSRTTSGPAGPSQIRVQGPVDPADRNRVEGRRKWGRSSEHTCKPANNARLLWTQELCTGPKFSPLDRALGVPGVRGTKCIVTSDLTRFLPDERGNTERVKAGCSPALSPSRSNPSQPRPRCAAARIILNGTLRQR